MAKVIVALTMSLDGFIAGSNDGDDRRLKRHGRRCAPTVSERCSGSSRQTSRFNPSNTAPVVGGSGPSLVPCHVRIHGGFVFGPSWLELEQRTISAPRISST